MPGAREEANTMDGSPDADRKTTEDPEALKAELERVRSEKDELAAKLAVSPEEHAKRRLLFWRTFFVVVLIVLGSVIAAVAVPAVWLDRTVTDTNVWVDTTAPLAQDPAVQTYVADTATNALFQQVDVQKLAEQALPPKLAPFAPAIAGAVKGFVSDQALAFTRSPQFYQAWVETNRIGQQAIVKAFTPGQQGAFSSSGGKVTLDIGTLVDTVKAKLVSSGLTIVQNVPTSAVQDRQIVLFESPYLAAAQNALIWMGAAAVGLPILALLLLGGAVALAVDRRKAVLWTGIGLVVAMLVPLESLYLGQYLVTNQVAQAAGSLPPAVADAFFNTILRYLVLAEQFIIVIGLMMIVAAVVAGPAGWAVKLRGGVSHGMSNIGGDWDFGPLGEWVLANKSMVRGAGLALGVLALVFIPAPKFSLLIWIVILEVVWLLLVELLGRPRPEGRGSTSSRPPVQPA
jgi:hypothetical protein